MNPFPQPRLDVGTDLNTEPKDVLELQMKSGKIEQTPTRLHVHEQIDITARTSLTARDRPENTHVRGAVPGGRLQDRGTPLPEQPQVGRCFRIVAEPLVRVPGTHH